METAEKLLNEQIVDQIRDIFTQLDKPVEILYFGSKTDCDYCEDTLQLVEEVAAISDKLRIQQLDIEDDAALARQYNVDKTPGLVIAARDADQIVDYGIRFAGIPSGHEFSSLIHDLVVVSSRDSGLNEKTRHFLQDLEQPVLLQVFVTPTCPYCPQAVLLAHQMALESPLVQAEMVEAMEFPDLAERHHVSGVPQTTINAGANHVVGAVPEDYLVEQIRQSIATTGKN